MLNDRTTDAFNTERTLLKLSRMMAVFAIALAVAALGCSGDDDDGSDGSGGSSLVSHSDCMSRCEDMIDACGAVDFDNGCSFCSRSDLTEKQMQCVEDLSCYSTSDEFYACFSSGGDDGEGDDGEGDEG